MDRLIRMMTISNGYRQNASSHNGAQNVYLLQTFMRRRMIMPQTRLLVLAYAHASTTWQRLKDHEHRSVSRLNVPSCLRSVPILTRSVT